MDTVRTPSDIGNIIRAARKRLGWDQARLANEIGVSRQWIIDIEKGKPRAELQLILRALHALGLELMLGPGVAQLPAARAPDHGTVTSINLDAIVEHHRSLDGLKNAGLHRPFSALDALKQSPVQAALAALNRYPSIIDASKK